MAKEIGAGEYKAHGNTHKPIGIYRQSNQVKRLAALARAFCSCWLLKLQKSLEIGKIVRKRSMAVILKQIEILSRTPLRPVGDLSILKLTANIPRRTAPVPTTAPNLVQCAPYNYTWRLGPYRLDSLITIYRGHRLRGRCSLVVSGQLCLLAVRLRRHVFSPSLSSG